MKDAIPSVEERTYRKGQVLVQQGKVPEGLFLILRGECELVISNILQEPNSTAEACGVQISGPSVAAVKKDSDMDFAGQLSSSSNSDDDDMDECDEEDGSYSPLVRSYNASAVKIAQAAMAAVAGGMGVMDTGGSFAAFSQQQLKKQLLLEQQLEQTMPGPRRDAAAAAAAGQPAGDADAVLLDHILPQLLPPPRWPGAPTGAGCHPATSSDCGAPSPQLPEVAAAAAAARNAAKSSGPVLLGADTALLAVAGQERAEDVFESPPRTPGSALGRGRQRSMSIDFSMSGMSGGYTPRDSIDRVSAFCGVVQCQWNGNIASA